MTNTQVDEAREVSERLNSEIRRGALVLAVLSQLQNEHYGYSLRKTLGDKGLDVEEGSALSANTKAREARITE